MATKVETENEGIKRKDKKDETFKELTSVVRKKKERKQDGDGEAGVDPQVEQLNTMPNDPTDQPMDKSTQRKKINK